MRRLVVAAAGLLLGCTLSQPQTRGEFVALVAGGASMTKTESHSAPRSFDRVVRTVRDRADACFNVEVTQTRQSGYAMSSFTVIYVPSFQVVAEDSAQLTIQHTTRPRSIGPQMPPGGFYTFAVDIDRVSGNETRLTMYGPSRGWGDAWDAIRAWSDGEKASCPFT